MDLAFKVEYRTVGIPKPIVDVCGQYLLSAHNRMAEITDGRYALWNKEWDDTHEGKSVIDDSCESEYIEFLNKKATPVVIPTLEKEFYHMTFEFGNEHQLIGHVKCLPGSSIEFYMLPINKIK